jgi:carbon starvation protein CstA
VPIFAIGIVLANVDFNVIWRYFGWANQSLAAIVLWAGAAYLYRKSKFHWICTAPAVFITSVSISYICFEKNMGFGLPINVSNIIGVAVAIVCLVALLLLGRRTIAGAPENV